MKNILAVARCLALLAAIFLSREPAAAQSQNPQALTWFKVGLAEKEPQKKIAAYLKALEYDPDFVEALYNIGIVFKKQQDYSSAEQYLLKAYHTKPDKTRRDSKFQILYELAGTYKKLAKAKEAEEAYRSIKNLAADPAMRGTITWSWLVHSMSRAAIKRRWSS